MTAMAMSTRHWRSLASLLLACGVASGAWAASPPAPFEVCSHTVWSILPQPACLGATNGQLTGAASELDTLSAQWGQVWTYAGSSADTDFGPFAGNPQVSFNGTLAFDAPLTGYFVIGLVSSGQNSLYLFNTKRRIGGLSFDSLEGVATTPQGNPFPLDYAVLYMSAPVPEPASWALGLLGLAGLGAAVRFGRRCDVSGPADRA
jgi:PEP-CTERM motif